MNSGIKLFGRNSFNLIQVRGDGVSKTSAGRVSQRELGLKPVEADAGDLPGEGGRPVSDAVADIDIQ